MSAVDAALVIIWLLLLAGTILGIATESNKAQRIQRKKNKK
jgi:hypothetical protein